MSSWLLSPARTLSLLCMLAGLSQPGLGAEPIALFPLDEQAGDFKLAIGDEGHISALWLGGLPPGRHVVYQRFAPDGTPLTPPVDAESGLDEWHSIVEFEVSRGYDGNDLVILRTTEGFIYGTSESLWATAFAPDGVQLFPLTWIATSSGFSQILDFAVQPRSSTGWLIAWPISSRIYSQRVSAASGPEGEAQLIGESAPVSIYWVALGVSDTSAFAVWSIPGSGPVGPLPDALVGRALDAAGQPSGPQLDLGTLQSPQDSISGLALDGFSGDRFALAGLLSLGFGSPDHRSEIRGGSFRSDASSIDFHPLVAGTPQVRFGSPFGYASDAKGRALLSWTRLVPTVGFVGQWQAFSPEGLPLSPISEVLGGGDSIVTSVAPGGRWVIGWQSLSVPGSGRFAMVELGSFQDGCISSGDALCLTGNRFRATATFHDHLGRDGVGQAVALTPESGTFWFFTAANVELILKVVDACGHPDFRDFWVYASGLTDVAVTLTVVDTWTGETWERETVLGEPFPPVLDSQAFHTCDAAPIVGPTVQPDIGH